MTDILDEFIENAKQSLQEGYYDFHEEAEVEKMSLKQKLLSQPFTLITEIKHASPAGEYSYKEINATEAAQKFRQSGADAISVVVEPKRFMGRIENVARAKTAGLPVLFKDFIFTEKQIVAAKRAGADAILLVVKVVERTSADLDFLVECAHRNGLEVLLESYDAEEFQTALESDADILGINNRDLRTLEVDINRTAVILKAVEKLAATQIEKPVISESGIKTADDVRFVKRSGVNGVLVGTAIWKAEDVGSKISELKSGGMANANE